MRWSASKRPSRPCAHWASAVAGHPNLNPIAGWGLAAAALVAGYVAWGWPGVVLGFTLVVFWLLLQFSRSLRVLRNAGRAPVGHVDSVVMLHSQVKAGMTLMQVLATTRSLGRKLGESPERWGWVDPGGARISLEFHDGKLRSWALTRDDAVDAPDHPSP
jgi:uncharacterized protein (DUF58 family)